MYCERVLRRPFLFIAGGRFVALRYREAGRWTAYEPWATLGHRSPYRDVRSSLSMRANSRTTQPERVSSQKA